MKLSLYPRLAASSIRKNGRFYLPYILTCSGMVMMFYIIHYLAAMPSLNSVSGGDVVKGCLGMGTYIVALFALLFLFYTNSFLMRRRKKEFGLYNILGMSKHNLSLVFLSETIMVAAVSLFCGLIGGISLSKLAELAMTKMLFDESSYDFYVNTEALQDSLLFFVLIFALIFLNGLRQIHQSNAVSLLHSENAGEQPPRANYLLGFGGFVVLAAAYYIAVSIESPLSALSWFFIAVGMVIVATYALFISGSVVLCRILQKNKRYYYKKNHFVAISSMAYRMKRNGAGLASVCILSTMVLVMMVGSSCLYFGAEDSLKSMYPKDIYLYMSSESIDDMQTNAIAGLEAQMADVIASHHAESKNLESYCTIALTGMLNNGFLETDSSTVNGIMESYSNICQVYFLSLADYNRCMGTHETLQPGQAMIYCIRTTYDEKTLDVSGCYTLDIVKHLEHMIRYEDEAAYMDIVPSIYLVVPDLLAVAEPLNKLATFSGRFTLRPRWNYSFDTNLSEEEQITLNKALSDKLAAINADNETAYYAAESRAANRADFYSTYGSLFFLGILLTIVFLFATVLILYYKQITEGYEDASRFEIMQKVGMTKTDIRKSVNSQMLTVFFLPLVTAVVHLGFAFPLVRKLLLLFHLTNLPLLLIVTAITVLIFAVFYGLVYSITARTYYTIVAGGDTAA